MKVPVWLSIVAGFATILGTFIAVHKFVIRRPRVQLAPEVNEGVRIDEQVVGTFSFDLANNGYSHAEDVYLEISLPSWNFNERDWSDSAISFSDSIVDVEHENDGYVGASGERHRIWVTDMLHSKSSFDFITASVRLEEFREYTVHYRIGCRSYSPREGEITIQSKYDGFEITHHPPRFHHAWIGQFITSIQEGFSWILSNTLSISHAQIEESGIITSRKSFFEFQGFPIVVVDTLYRDQEPLSVKLKGTISTDTGDILGTIKLTANSVKPGDRWIATPTNLHSYASSSLPATSDYQAFSKMPLRLDPTIPPYLYNPEHQISISWEAEIDHPEKGDMRGIEINQSSLEVREFRDSTLAKLTINIQNENHSSKSFFVVGRLYTSTGLLIDTPTQHVVLDELESKELHISTRLPEVIQPPEDMEIALQRTQSSSVENFDV
ncbi:hypothetical protein [Halobacterium hubeiense]|uniref:hypothetical protein n=1 Tax=Halobacterium hubeiense TaxID=1407499 RepID=UPI003C712519